MGNEKVDAVLTDLATAPINEPLRATLALLRKVTREHEAITPQDIEPLLAHGLSRAKIEDALAVGFCFNVITRLADTFKFEVGPQESFDASAKALLSRGYKL
jgi:alkylhydroperoxidase family enzyme